MRRLNQLFQIKYDFAESATELQSKIRLKFNIWFRSRISHVPNIMRVGVFFWFQSYYNSQFTFVLGIIFQFFVYSFTLVFLYFVIFPILF